MFPPAAGCRLPPVSRQGPEALRHRSAFFRRVLTRCPDRSDHLEREPATLARGFATSPRLPTCSSPFGTSCLVSLGLDPVLSDRSSRSALRGRAPLADVCHQPIRKHTPLDLDTRPLVLGCSAYAAPHQQSEIGVLCSSWSSGCCQPSSVELPSTAFAASNPGARS
jgi:hypothetical protein